MTCGAVNALATMFSAVSLRTPLIGMRCSRSGAERRRRRRRDACRAGRGRRRRGLHVVAGDRALRAGAGDRGQVDAEVPGQLAHRRLGQHRHRAGGRRRRRWPRRRPERRPPATGAAALGAGAGTGAAGGVGLARRGAWPRRSSGRSRPAPPCGRPVPDHRSGRARPRPRPARSRPRPATRPTAPGGASASGRAGSVSMAMIGAPTSTIVPSAWKIVVTLPAHFAGISTAALAVSTSTIGWFSSIVSPTLTSHLRISPSVRPSPRSGRLNSLIRVTAASPDRTSGRRRRAPGRGRAGTPPPRGRPGTGCRSRSPAAPAPPASRSTPR